MKDNITKQDLETIELPNYCYVAVPSDNIIGIVKKGETGYYKTDLAECNNIKDYDELNKFVDEINEERGVSKKQRAIMQLKSMYGTW